MGSSPVAVTQTSDTVPVLSKVFLDIQVNVEWGFTLTCVRNTITTCSQMHHIDKYSQHRSIIWPVLRNGWVFAYKLSSCGLEAHCSHLNFRYYACLEQVVRWHSGKNIVRIHSELPNWHDNTYSRMHRTVKYLQHSSFIWSVCPNRWVFVYELSGSGFESCWSHLRFRYHVAFE